MQRIRVLHLINDLRAQGGAEAALANLVSHLDQKKLDVWVGGLFGLGPLVERLGIPPQQVVSFDFQPRFYLDAFSVWKLIKFLKEHQIQIVHTHLFASSTIGRIGAFLAQVPVVVASEHNTYVTKSRLSIMVDRVLALVTTQMIANAEAVRLFAARQAGIHQDRFIVIFNGVDMEQIPIYSMQERLQKRFELGVYDDRPIIVSIGRLTEQKGHIFLVQAARQVLAEYPAALFLIVGSGALEEELHREIERMEVKENFRLLGYRNDLAALMQASTLVAMPSLWEGLPMTLVQAAACGVPVVATDVGGVAEVVFHGGNGLLVPPRDVEALAGAILRMLSAPDMRQKMGMYGQIEVAPRFSASQVAQQMTDLYYHLWTSYQCQR